MKSIVALLSGGVDSAVALSRFIEQYPEKKPCITAYYLKIWLEDELSFLGECPWKEDLVFATNTTEQLGIPLEVISLQREYHDKVVSYTIDELKKGGTPSPDIFCNQFIKFGAFLDRIQGADLVISGHYASIKHDGNTSYLYQAVDPIKDQTYFLSHLSAKQLSCITFPIGTMHKQEVRQYAQEKQLPPSQRKDSQGICFLGKIKYKDFVKYHLGTKQGNIIDKQTHNILGTHDGSWFYTIGQRSGLGLNGGPWYVCKKSFSENIVWVQHGTFLEQEYIDTIPVAHIHWIHNPYQRSFIQQNTPFISIANLHVKVRHGEDMIPAHLVYNTETHTGTVHLSRGDTGIATGQYTVLYHQAECLGCARIE